MSDGLTCPTGFEDEGKGSTSQGMQEVCSSWKRQGDVPYAEPTERNAALLTPNFSTVRYMLDFQPPEL